MKKLRIKHKCAIGKKGDIIEFPLPNQINFAISNPSIVDIIEDRDDIVIKEVKPSTEVDDSIGEYKWV